MRRRGVIAALVFLTLFGSQQVFAQTTKSAKMQDVFFKGSLERPVSLDEPPRPIEPVTVKPSWTTTQPAVDAGGWSRAFGNNRLNSRSSYSPGRGPWTLRWKCDLPGSPAPPAQFVLADADRIAVQTDSDWKLYDTDGALIGQGVHAGGLLLDGPFETLFFPDTDGDISARKLSDARSRFTIEAFFDESFARTYFARREDALFVLGVELDIDPHRHHRPELSVAQFIHMGEEPKVDLDGYLEPQLGPQPLLRKSTRVLAVLGESRVTLATPGAIYQVNFKLEIVDSFGGEFNPIAMSLDEQDRICLLVDAEGVRQVWLLTPLGKRIMASRLPAPLHAAAHPPIIGYNRRIYMHTSSHIAAIEPDGSLAWMRPALHRFGGVAITADDKLLASDGGEIVYFGPSGERVTVHDFKSDRLATAPVLTDKGELIVAGEKHLYCLTPPAKQKPE